MAFPPYLQVTLNWSSSSVSYESKLYYRAAGGGEAYWDQTNIKTIADAIYAKIDGPLRAVIPAYVFLNPITVRSQGGAIDVEDQSSEDSAPGLYVTSIPELDETDVMPEGNQVVIQRRTGLRGRSKRGRVFLPFVPEELADNSTLNAVGLDRYKAVAGVFSSNITVPEYGDLEAVTLDYKNQLCLHVTQCRVVSEVLYRRDRRAPKRPVYFAAPVTP